MAAPLRDDLEPFDVEQLHELRRVSSPAANRAGDIVYSQREWTRGASGPGIVTTNLQIVAWNSKVPRALTNLTGVTDTAATFSNDGATVFFLSSRSGSMQVWAIPVDGGEGQQYQVSNFPVDVDNLRFFQDKNGNPMLLTTMSVYYDKCAPADLSCTAKLNAKVEARGPNTWKEYTELFVRHWDEWEVEGKAEHVFVQKLIVSGSGKKYVIDPKSVVDIMGGQKVDAPVPPFGGMEQIDISPKGDEIAYTGVTRESSAAWTTGWKVYIYSLKTAQTTCISDSPARATNPAYSPDGRYIAYLAMNWPGRESDKLHIVRYDRKHPDQTVTVTNSTDISFSGITWEPRSQAILADADYQGYHMLFSVDMINTPDATGKPVDLITPLSGAYSTPIWIPRAVSVPSYLAVWSSMMAPADLVGFSFYFNGSSGHGSIEDSWQITNVNADLLDGYALQTPERFSFTGALGQTVYGWIIKPFGYTQGKTYPVVNLIHGGPEGTWDDAWSYRWNPQLWTGHGYGVVMIDFHGSTGYGQAFTDSILGNWGSYPYEDVMTGISVAVSRNSWMDGNRLVACGASYGGYMVNWIQGHTDKYRALVTHDGMFDTYAAYFSTDELWFNEAEFNGVPWENPALYDKYNPRNYVSQWKTPHLIIHGQRDYRLTLDHGLSAFTALQRRGIPSKLLYFTMENHWVLNDENGIKWYHTVLDWLDTHSGPQ